jgi:hypothetical protein
MDVSRKQDALARESYSAFIMRGRLRVQNAHSAELRHTKRAHLPPGCFFSEQSALKPSLGFGQIDCI